MMGKTSLMSFVLLASLGNLAVLAPNGFGETRTWDGGGVSNRWNEANNWSPDGVPAPNDHVYVYFDSPNATSKVYANDGSITVSNTAHVTFNKGLYIGNTDTGALYILNGGQVVGGGRIGFESGSFGQATVDGVNSSWIGARLHVGCNGSGTLDILNGGRVLTYYSTATIGSESHVTVNGSGSLWQVTEISVGGRGTLTIESGGLVSSGDTAGIGGDVTVSGAASMFSVGYILFVSGTLTIEKSGFVSNGPCKVNYSNYSSTGQASVIVDGLESTWTNNGDLRVGDSGSGMLTIQNGGVVLTTGNCYVGVGVEGNGHVIVDGPYSIWTTTGSLLVGSSVIGGLIEHLGGTVTVSQDLHFGDLCFGPQWVSTGIYELSGNSELRIGGTVHLSRTRGDYAEPPYSIGEFIVNGGTVRGVTDDACMIAHGSNASIIGPGTYDIKVIYESDPNYCDEQTVDLTFGRNKLLVGGNYNVKKITPADFAGGTLTNLLYSSVFDVSFDGTSSESYKITIPYNETEVPAPMTKESSLMILRETGPQAYEQLEIIDVNSDLNRITARSKSFGKFAVATSTIEVIDPYPDLMSNGEVITDLEKLGSDLGRVVSGIVADGATPVLIKAQLPGSGWVGFSIRDENGASSDVGFLNTPGGNERSTTLWVPVVRLLYGRYMAFAVLTAPPAFVRRLSDQGRQNRPIIIGATYQHDPPPLGAASTEGSEQTRQIKLVRPAVIMVHGLWSDAGAFCDLNTELANNGFLFLYRPSYNNSASFHTNDSVLPHLIKNVLANLRTGAYACTKVDIVGHSMGGLLAKRLPKDFAQQNIRKIITIGTPYLGSPLADRLYDIYTGHPSFGRFLEQRINRALNTQDAIRGGAIQNLKVEDNNEPPISTQIPGVDCQNVIVGRRDGTNPPRFLIAILKNVTGAWTAEGAHDLIFGVGANSDWIVAEPSQRGDAHNYQPLDVAWHCTETQDDDVISQVLLALNLPAQIGESQFAGGLPEPPNISGYESKSVPKAMYLTLADPNGTVEIIEPTEGQMCLAGQSVSISVKGTGDTSHAAVFTHFGSATWGDIVELPWQGDVNIPDNCVGSEAQVAAIGLDSNMNMTNQDEVVLVLGTNVVLEDIIFGFGDRWTFDFKTYLQQSHEFQLYPLGVFSDGSEYPLSVLSEDIIYESYNDAIVSVDTNGLVKPHSQGTAVLTVTCSSKTTSLVIEVDTYLQDLYPDGTIDFHDISVLASQWLQSPVLPSADIAPPNGDGKVDFLDLAALVKFWLTVMTTPQLPGQASNPNPPDGATDINLTAIMLSWTAGSDARSHDIYFGITNPPPFIGNQTSTIFEPGCLISGTKFYWRVDEVNGWGKTEGPVWSFTTTTIIPPPPSANRQS